MSEKRTPLRRAAITSGVIVILLIFRISLEPRRTEARPLRLSPGDRSHVSAAVTASALGRAAFLDEMTRQRVLLVGEAHLAQEPQTFVMQLVSDLHARDGRRALLLLELPAPMQGAIDRYLSTGDESVLTTEWHRYQRFALPYQPLVKWARAHPEAVSGIVADDERPLHAGLMRLMLTDTRNETMARAVADGCRTHPSDRVIVFGGRFHMMKGGRYLYDSPTRSPIGARLKTMPDAPREIAAVWLFAGDRPAAGTWSSPGAISFARDAGTLPIRVLEDEAVFGASTLREVADYAVYLGAATPTEN